MKRIVPLEERYWSKVKKSENGCWEWAASIDTHGYGHIKVDGRLKLSHRVAYELAFGTIPEGLLVCHKCDNRRCVNPDHLFLGTNDDNVHDAVVKGRLHTPQYRAKLSQRMKGSNNPCFRKVYSQEERKIMSEQRRGTNSVCYGKKRSEEDKRKMREGWKRRKERLKVINEK
ncbi:HNH endonuclease [Gordoniibacillus kamchatkensis]|uniref:HNH endonuclease n=1 Tax=Gordoniibacillus kamchatkensis TaxID=1590651 RepID=UPI0009E37A61|nr:HNH endonuclease [Paenibacillus sp. VKM B-2647]